MVHIGAIDVAALTQVVQPGGVVAAGLGGALGIPLRPLPVTDAKRSAGKRHAVQYGLVIGDFVFLFAFLPWRFGAFSYIMIRFYWLVVL